MLKDTWDIPVIQKVTLRVVFDEPVTFQEAKQLFLDDHYEDIIDERDQEFFGFPDQFEEVEE